MKFRIVKEKPHFYSFNNAGVDNECLKRIDFTAEVWDDTTVPSIPKWVSLGNFTSQEAAEDHITQYKRVYKVIEIKD